VLDPAPTSLEALRFKAGEPQGARERFSAGEAVLVTEPFASRYGVDPGDSVRLNTARGMQRFPVAGVYYDYNTERGIVLMQRDLYARWWDGDRISSLGVYVAPDADFDAVTERVRKVAATGPPVQVRTSAHIRERSLEVFDQTFAITAVLRMLAIAVAFVAVLTSLLALQFERTRELAILRATGATPAQVRGHVLMQTGTIGLLAGLLSIPLGLGLSQLLIHVINRRAFGWTIETAIYPLLLLQALGLAVGAALLAGLTALVSLGYVAIGVYVARRYSGLGVRGLSTFAIVWGANFLLNSAVIVTLAQYGVLSGTQLQSLSVPPLVELALVSTTPISGLLAGFLVLYPGVKVVTLLVVVYYVTVVNLPAWLLIGFWILLQGLYGLVSLGAGQFGGVAWFAHLGGFAGGFVLILLNKCTGLIR
jgi:ABC-type antimicrobial peptide transport system permease subunit